MESRKVYVDVKFRLNIEMDETVTVDDVLFEMNCNFISNTDNAEIVDSEMVECEIVDSK